MDSKAVFFKTGKGEDESSGKTANLYSAIKRVLLMVDGVATFGEISKRAAPSMRDSLDEMFQELEKGGFIHDKAQVVNIPKMSVPHKTAPPIDKPVEEAGGVLDFMDEFFASMPAQLAAEAAKAGKIKGEDEAKSKQEIEAARLKMHQAEAARLKAEQKAAKASAETAEFSKKKAAAEAGVLYETVKPKLGVDPSARSTSATVLFFDLVGYTKQPVNKQVEVKKKFSQLISDCLRAQGDGERIILDTGDGAAIGFLQHPEDALKAAMQFHNTVRDGQHQGYADLKVRIGIHLGPINVVKDMNGRSNMVGDGINDAQRVMDFAGSNQIYISRPYYDFISRLSDEYAEMFQYRGSQNDKHGREHPVYELVDAAVPDAEAMLPHGGEAAPAIKLDPFFVFDPFQIQTSPPTTPQKKKVSAVDVEPEIKLDAFIFDAPKAAIPPGDTPKTTQSAEDRQPVKQQVPSPAAPQPVESKPSQEQIKRAEEQHIAAQAQAKKLADAQAKSWAEAEQREADAAKARAELTSQKIALSAAKTSSAVPRVPISRTSRKPFPWGKLAIFLLVLLAGALFVAPYVLPMRDYMPKVEQLLSAKLQQPVHIGQLGGRILPTPRLELGEIFIGDVKQFQVGQAQIYFSILGLLGETKPIDSIELQGVKVTGAGLPAVSAWLQQLAADEQYPVRRMAISQGTLDADAIQFTGIEGELIFNQAGKFTRADLRANAGKIALAINAVQDGNRESRAQVDIRMHTSALPLLPSWSFDELTAKGELSSNGLRISEFDGRLLGGILQGNANIDWHSGWRAQGTLVAKTITMQNMSKSLSGDMEGSARFQMQATSLSGLADAATLDGTFVVRKGVINGIDIVEMARSRSTESVPGGRTHFDELSGVMTVAKDGYAFRQLKMNAGALIVSGTLDIAGQQVSGRISADLTKWAEMGKVTMQVGGTTDNPSLRAAR